jgi:hypothetical protein
MNLTEQLLEAMPIVLEEFGAWLGINQDPNAAYPIVTYSIVADTVVGDAGSFDSVSETFLVQVAVYDDEASCERLATTQAEVEAAMLDVSKYAGYGLVEVRYIGGRGPVYLGADKNWQYLKMFRVVLARDRVEPDPES